MTGDMLMTQDRDTIIEWAEYRSAHAARVAGAHDEATDDLEPSVGALRLGFPGYAGEEVLEPMGWDDWFDEFEAQSLTFGYRVAGPNGGASNEYAIFDED